MDRAKEPHKSADSASAPYLTDPCEERDDVGAKLREDLPAAQLDVFLMGPVFIDMIFSGLSGPPPSGCEVWSTGLGSAPGGVANLAVAMSRLGLRVGLAAGFGDDMFGAYLWQTLAEQERVDLSSSRRLSRWPTPVTVSLCYDRDRTMITYAEPLPFPLAKLVTKMPNTRSCLLQLDGEYPDWAKTLRAEGGLVFADVGWDTTQTWSLSALYDQLDHVDVFLPNSVEAMAYTRTDSVHSALAVLGERVPVVIVKDGANGAVGLDSRTGEKVDLPALPIEVPLDPTGAGDVFAAAFMFATLAEWSLSERVRFANLCAGLSVEEYSGSLGAPCWGRLAEWWSEAVQIPEFQRDYSFLEPYLPHAQVDLAPHAFPTMGYTTSS